MIFSILPIFKLWSLNKRSRPYACIVKLVILNVIIMPRYFDDLLDKKMI
ncbi:Uncharacterised protein [Vibrio cholerae]|nr:Uncharacterised protein [Vibrio cholerae]